MATAKKRRGVAEESTPEVPPRLAIVGHAKVPADKLKFFPGNAKEGDDEAIDESLGAHGVYKSLTVNRRTMQVLVGNNTLRRLRALGTKLVSVEYVDVDDDEARAINLVDNATARAGRLLEKPLAKALEQARKSQSGLIGTGYSTASVDKLLQSLRNARSARAGKGAVEIPDVYQVVVECKTEKQQETLIAELLRRKFKVRALLA